MFVPHSLTKLHNIAECKRVTGAETVIEVGAYKGVTTKRLSHIFNEVISIEIDESLYRIAKERNKRRGNVELILGDGSQVLPDILPRTSKCIIFLDGHFSGGDTGQGDVPEPVLKELDLIRPWLDEVYGIVLDDFRLFGVEPGWPKKSQIFEKFEQVFSGKEWKLAVQYDQVLVTRISDAKA